MATYRKAKTILEDLTCYLVTEVLDNIEYAYYEQGAKDDKALFMTKGDRPIVLEEKDILCILRNNEIRSFTGTKEAYVVDISNCEFELMTFTSIIQIYPARMTEERGLEVEVNHKGLALLLDTFNKMHDRAYMDETQKMRDDYRTKRRWAAVEEIEFREDAIKL